MELPKFKYHLNPTKSGSITESDAECECCGEARGFIYTGPVYAEEELDDCICPWCITSGAAHKEFDAEFTDIDGIGGRGIWDDVPDSTKEEVAFRTPGFAGWQQERWWTHCGDAGVFLGIAGKGDIEQYGNLLIDNLKKESGYSDTQWKPYFDALSKDGSPTAYIFKCRHCGEIGGYSDCD